MFIEGMEGGDTTTYDWASWPMDKRVTEARKLLTEAGVKPGIKLKFSYNTCLLYTSDAADE